MIEAIALNAEEHVDDLLGQGSAAFGTCELILSPWHGSVDLLERPAMFIQHLLVEALDAVGGLLGERSKTACTDLSGGSEHLWMILGFVDSYGRWIEMGYCCWRRK